LVILLASREETRGAWVKFKKPTLHAMPVLDVTKLAQSQLNVLDSAYLEICKEPLQALPLIDNDPVRSRIDGAFEDALGLSGLSTLRTMLANEPIISLRPL
jgi:hypothetical protein